MPDKEQHLLVMKGAPERILDRCSSILLNGEVIDMPADRFLNLDTNLEFFGFTKNTVKLCWVT